VVALAVLAGLVALALVQLGANDQLDPEKWGPLFNPANRYFVATWSALWVGLSLTLVAAALTLVLSLAIGTALAVARISSAPWYRWLVVSVIELLRGCPSSSRSSSRRGCCRSWASRCRRCGTWSSGSPPTTA
jgi:glutamate transport system permease protein